MRIAVLKERAAGEARVSATPETVKKFNALGATLARLEGQEAFRALAERFESLRIETDEIEYQPSISFRSIKSLPVTWN